MRTVKLGPTDLQVPVVAVGCMRMDTLSIPAARNFIETALSLGANFFDHADVYGGAVSSEAIFSEAIAMSPRVRERVILQSKCGLRTNSYDFSKEHILRAVDGSLKRLGTEYLDILLLHRPDALVEPEEVAQAFDVLESSGKVRYFGVSNHNPMQIALLKKYVRQPLVANQLQFSITNANMVAQGINVNMDNAYAPMRDGSVLDYCRLNDITIQPWSPFLYGFFDGVFLDNPKFPALNQSIDTLAQKHGVANTTIALAWILRHPAQMQPIIGTMNGERLQDSLKASDVHLSREEWYAIYRSAGYPLP